MSDMNRIQGTPRPAFFNVSRCASFRAEFGTQVSYSRPGRSYLAKQLHSLTGLGRGFASFLGQPPRYSSQMRRPFWMNFLERQQPAYGGGGVTTMLLQGGLRRHGKLAEWSPEENDTP